MVRVTVRLLSWFVRMPIRAAISLILHFKPAMQHILSSRQCKTLENTSDWSTVSIFVIHTHIIHKAAQRGYIQSN